MGEHPLTDSFEHQVKAGVPHFGSSSFVPAEREPSGTVPKQCLKSTLSCSSSGQSVDSISSLAGAGTGDADKPKATQHQPVSIQQLEL